MCESPAAHIGTQSVTKLSISGIHIPYTQTCVVFYFVKHAERQSLYQQSVHSRTTEGKYWNDFKHLSAASWGTLKCVTEV